MAYLGNPEGTLGIIRKFKINIQKKFGQNFLVDADILDQIVDAAQIGSDDCVLEIGPGIGTLTQLLAEKAGKVVAIEIDKALMPILDFTLSDYSNIEVINKDVLKVSIADIVRDKNDGKPIKVVANLPYYITTPIIMKLFEDAAPIKSITVMVQKEVADRMSMHPGSRDYGALSIAVQYYSRPEIITDVPPSSFIPRPDVDSAVIRLTRFEKPPVDVDNEEFFFNVVKASFAQRRKTLINGIGNASYLGVNKADAQEALESMGKAANIRGEQLSLEEFARLSNILGKSSKTAL